MYENREQHEQRLEEERESKFEHEVRERLEAQSELLQEILDDVKPSHTVTGGHIRQIGNPMIALKPGNSPKFAISPLPAGAKTFAAQVKVTSADPADVITLDPADPSGLTFTDLINPAAVEPVTLTLTWEYTNTDGSVASVVGTFSEVTDVTGGTMTQVA
jgi:hypothetical protein